MPAEPATKRVAAFFDGQNLYYSAKKAFGYKHPNYNPTALADRIAKIQGWVLTKVSFYTGIPDERYDPEGAHFWTAKLITMKSQGVQTFCRTLRYRDKSIILPDGSSMPVIVGQEKGIDIRIALDVVMQAGEKLYDVAMIFSQDQDLSEVADAVRVISMTQSRWIQVASAFPTSPRYKNKRGINGTKWITIDQATYDACVDPQDYRAKRKPLRK